jgi:hypothetical protein
MATPLHPLGQQDRLLDYGALLRAGWSSGSRRRAVSTAGPFQGLRADLEQWTPLSTPPGPQPEYVQRNYWPDRSAIWLCLSTLRQADDLNTRPLGSGPTRQSDARDGHLFF